MSSFVCKHAPWRYEPCIHPPNKVYTYVVLSNTASHSLHMNERSARFTVDALNTRAALEILSGKPPEHSYVPTYIHEAEPNEDSIIGVMMGCNP